MKKKTDHISEEHLKGRKHPILQKLSAVLLSVCLLIVSLPMDFFDLDVKAEEMSRHIISFFELPDEIKNQIVDTGTSLKSLNLPNSLTAVCSSVGNYTDSSQKDAPEKKESGEYIQEETVAIESVTWVSNPLYDNQITGSYTFLPVLPEGYGAADNVELPEIKVVVKEPEHQQEAPEEEPVDDEINYGLEGMLEEGEAGEIAERKLKETDEIEEQIMKSNDDTEDVALTENVDVLPDTIWEGTKTLQDCNLNINSDVTLKMAGELQIEGDVTIKGGGRIEGKGSGFTITVGSNAKLTLGNITIDGASIPEWKATLINVTKGGELTLDAGCTIENIHVNATIDSKFNPNLIYFGENTKGFFKENAAIRNCSCKRTSSFDTYENIINMGKYSARRSELTIDGGIYEYNKGDSFLFTQGVTTINGGTFQYNYGTGSSLINQDLISSSGNQIIINGGTFQKNESKSDGTIRIWTQDELHINGGDFIENTTNYSGGCVDVRGHGKVYITGGNFLRNHAKKYGGCIYSSSTDEIHIDGGNFEGNTAGSDPNDLKGSGAIYIDAYLYKFDNQQWYGKSFFSGKAKFDVDTSTESDRDAITFQDRDTNSEYGRLYIKGSLETPIKMFVNAEEGYVICEGSEYTLTEEDAEQIIVVDKVNHEKKWRKVLDEVKNQIYLSPGGEEPETLTADFYSGSEVQKESQTVELHDAEGVIKTLSLKELSGWKSLGWSRNRDSYTDEIKENVDVTLTENASFYGVYQKDITLSYDLNGGEGTAPEPETKPGYANVHEEISYQMPEFQIGEAPTREGYLFRGWNSSPEGEDGTFFTPGEKKNFENDTVLYAIWEKDEKLEAYKVEHYLQDLEGDGYTKTEEDTQTLFGEKHTVVTAEPKTYQGFHENKNHPEQKAKGTVAEDGSLVLKLYYDRNVYEVSFDLNGGDGTAPDTQHIRYGGLLQQVTEPGKKGYNFKGWHLEQEGLDAGLWEFDVPVEKNTESLQTTLYAKWKDELAPEAGKAAFNSGHKNFLKWVIQKRDLVITVPVVEEGSGLAEVSYILTPEKGEKTKGKAQFYETSDATEKSLSYGSGASVSRMIQKGAGTGKYEARITVEENFKGTVSITCRDKAGNISAEKLLTSYGGGIIVEDNAPIITFSNTEEKTVGEPIEAEVLVEDARDESITGGLAEISYQVDEGEEKAVPQEKFEKEIVESYQFKVTVEGEGKHILLVTAKDRVGNESGRRVVLNISKKKDRPIKGPEEKNPKKPGGLPKPKGPEPRTGESSHVKIYATFAMIAGFGYLLLYFAEENGITEQEKEEIIHRLVEWAKRGGSLRRMFAVAVIFLFLAYYHSIGKSVTVEWRDVCREKAGRKSKE